MGPVLVDANLLLLLVVGSADRRYIAIHKRLSGYTEADFELLVEAISLFSDIVLVPHVLAEVSSLSRQVQDPARSRIQEKFRDLVEMSGEVTVSSVDGVHREEFLALGLTDAVMLHLCGAIDAALGLTLLTNDARLAVQAEMLGYDVLNFSHLR